jgi:hypothetical protein
MTTSMPELTWDRTTTLDMLSSNFEMRAMIISAILGGIMCSNSRLSLIVLLPLMVELVTVEAETVLLVCYALLFPTHVSISPRTVALNAGIQFTVLFGAAKIGRSTGVLAMVVG